MVSASLANLSGGRSRWAESEERVEMGMACMRRCLITSLSIVR